MSKRIARTAVFVAASIIVAVASMQHALVMTSRAQRPAMALTLDSGEPVATIKAIAPRFTEAANEKERPDFVGPVAQSSLRRMALNPTALRFLALSKGETVGSQVNYQLVQLSYQVSRRDLGTNTLMIQEGLQNQNLPQILGAYDMILRSQDEAWPRFMPLLAQAIEVAGENPDVLALIDSRPPWLSEFFLRALNDTKKPEIYHSLLLNQNRILRIDQSEEIERRLINQLFFTAQYGLAREVYAKQRRAKSGDLESLAIEADSFRDDYTVFDWIIFREPSVGAEPVGGGAVSVYADVGRIGRVMQKNLVLAPGDYTIEAQVTDDTTNQRPGELRWTFLCFQEGSASAVRSAIPADGQSGAGTQRWSFTVPVECLVSGLELSIKGGDGPGPSDLFIESISLRPS